MSVYSMCLHVCPGLLVFLSKFALVVCRLVCLKDQSLKVHNT